MPKPATATSYRARFDNELDRSAAAERLYMEEMREFKAFLVANTEVPELRELNLLGVQFGG